MRKETTLSCCITDVATTETDAGTWLTIPNALSLARLLLGLGYAWLPAPWRPFAVVVAAVTDLLDGPLSRATHAASTLGRGLDPIADKVFVAAVLATMLIEGDLTLGQAALVAARDIAVVLGALWVLARRDWSTAIAVRPSGLGKLTTALQMVTLFALLLDAEIARYMLAPTVVVSVLAGLDYLRRTIKASAQSKRREKSRTDDPIPPVLARYIAGLMAHDVAQISTTLADDVAFVTPERAFAKPELIAFLSALYAAFPDWHYDQDEPESRGDGHYAVRWRQGGTHTEALRLSEKPEVPATGKSVRVPEQFFFYTVAGDRIVEIRPDPIPGGAPWGIMEQIGADMSSVPPTHGDRQETPAGPGPPK